VTARERLLDAAEICLKEHGIRRTTMAMVAEQAGVSRAWLYRHFPDKPTLVGAAVVRLDEAFWDEAHARIRRQKGLARKVAEAVRMSRAHEPPLALQLREQEPEEFALAVGKELQQAMPGMGDFWHPYLAEARDAGEVRADLDVPRAAEWVIRVVLSLVTLPRDDDVLPFLEEFLLPSLR
jgi:AcrR family transcriptional regulator